MVAVWKAKEKNIPCIVITFTPHPQDFFQPGSFQAIIRNEQKIRLMKLLGVDGLLLLPFNKQLACIAPEAFVLDILVDQLKVKDVFVGENFCFGKDRAGRKETLKILGKKWGFDAHAIPLLRDKDGEIINSTRIRTLIEGGKKKEAQELLGWPKNFRASI